jgi:hypothetical protein
MRQTSQAVWDAGRRLWERCFGTLRRAPMPDLSLSEWASGPRLWPARYGESRRVRRKRRSLMAWCRKGKLNAFH